MFSLALVKHLRQQLDAIRWFKRVSLKVKIRNLPAQLLSERTEVIYVKRNSQVMQREAEEEKKRKVVEEDEEDEVIAQD